MRAKVLSEFKIPSDEAGLSTFADADNGHDGYGWLDVVLLYVRLFFSEHTLGLFFLQCHTYASNSSGHFTQTRGYLRPLRAHSILFALNLTNM